MSTALEIANACVPSAESELPIMPHARAILVGVARDRIQAALDEARRNAIEDAAQKVEQFYIAPKPTSRAAQFHERNVRAILAAEVRALLSESKS